MGSTVVISTNVNWVGNNSLLCGKYMFASIIRFRRTQVVFLISFLFLNCAVYLMAQPNYEDGRLLHPAFWNASDGQRYWGVAKNLVENGSFSIGSLAGESLMRGGPVPAIVFALPIRLFNFDAASKWIVGIQCTLLFLLGVFARELCAPYGANKDVLQGLLIFNPNLIGLAHHAQSDLLFTFLFTISLVLAMRILLQPNNQKATLFVLLGVTLGLLPLTRPLGFYYVLFLLAYLCAVMTMGVLADRRTIRKNIINLSIIIVMAVLIALPWGIRNKNTFGHLSVTYSEGIMMQWHYKALRKYSSSRHTDLLGEQHFLDKHGVTKDCLAESSCKAELVGAYVDAILSTPKIEIGRALLSSWGKLFVSGGISQLSRYMGVDTPDAHRFLTTSRGLISESATFVLEMVRKHSMFLGMFVVAVGFAGICRLLGIFGLVIALGDRRVWGCTLFYMMCIGLFLSMYLFSSIARFRAPLEPILMLFSAVGVGWVAQLSKFVRKQ